MTLKERAGKILARYLSRPRKVASQVATSTPEMLAGTLQPGDVLLVDGNSSFSQVIKYLTQSCWSHAALYVGDVLSPATADGEPLCLVEADINEGVRGAPLSFYTSLHTRICRPIGLSNKEIEAVVNYVVSRMGHRYDLQNIFDLARYLLPTPPVPVRFRRRLLSLGSGDPTQAICSSLIALAFQSVQYPILPEVVVQKSNDADCVKCYREMLHIRHHSLFTPRDFDVSPYFKILKPTLEFGFDPHELAWSTDPQVPEADTIPERA